MLMRRSAPFLLVIAFTPTVAQQPVQQRAGDADTLVFSLPSLVSVALRDNISLRDASLGPRYAMSDLLSARAGFDPTLALSTQRVSSADDVLGIRPQSYLRSDERLASLGVRLSTGSQLGLSFLNSSISSDPYTQTSTLPFPTSHASSLNLSFSQPLLRGLGRAGSYGLVDAASTAIEAARFRYDRAADLVVAQVEHAYWLLRQAESDENVLRQSVEASRAIYDRNVALQARDVATALDVLTSERGLATRETQFWDAQRQRVDAAERLLFLVYGEGARDALLTQARDAHTSADTAVVPVVPTVAAAEEMAYAHRSDAAAAIRDVEAGRRRAQQARSQRLPRLDLIAGYGYGGTAPTTRFLNFGDSANVRSSTWTLGFSASAFQRNDAAAAVDQRAESDLESARLAQASTANAVREEVRAAVRALQTGRDRYLGAHRVASLAEREYSAAREGARLGLITTFQLLQYEDQLAQARLLLAQTRFALEDAGTQYRLATGESRRGYLPAADATRQR
jgi:outer membrane protein TolC